MQSVSSRIWTRVAVSISYDDNDYTTGTSIKNERGNANDNRDEWCERESRESLRLDDDDDDIISHSNP